MVEKRCARCATPFGCGREAAGCWCSALPALPAAALDAARDCLCPRCLAALTAAADAADEHRSDPDPPA